MSKDEPSLDEVAEDMLTAYARLTGRTLSDLGVLSAREIATIERIEVPISSVDTRDDEESDAE